MKRIIFLLLLLLTSCCRVEEIPPDEECSFYCLSLYEMRNCSTYYWYQTQKTTYIPPFENETVGYCFCKLKNCSNNMDYNLVSNYTSIQKNGTTTFLMMVTPQCR